MIQSGAIYAVVATMVISPAYDADADIDAIAEQEIEPRVVIQQTVEMPSQDIIELEPQSVPEAEAAPVVEQEVEQRTYVGTFKVTAYCPCSKCNGKWGGQTATGVKPQAGITVAVDRSVIPLGSKLYIDGVGEVIAQDTGVKGNKIDLFMNSHKQALQWGVQRLDVWIGE